MILNCTILSPLWLLLLLKIFDYDDPATVRFSIIDKFRELFTDVFPNGALFFILS